MGLLERDRKCVCRGHDTAKGGQWIVPLKAGFGSQVGPGTFWMKDMRGNHERGRYDPNH